MKIKMLTSVAGAHESHAPGDLVDKPDDVARVWINEALAIEAPEQEVAAERVAELSRALDGVSAEREGLAKQATDLAGKLASAAKEKAGAVAEADVHRKAADALRQKIEEINSTFDQYKAAASTSLSKTLSDAAATRATLEAERDEFKRQAEALAEQLATLGASLLTAPKA